MSEANSSPDSVNLPRLGSYQILRPLGSGGMSNVFQAVHEESGSVVALKVLPRKLAQNAVLLQRFLKEAKSAENLDHPNIVAIYDRGFDQGRHYLVLEYVEGRDLFDRVRFNGVLTPIETVAFVRQVALGLQYAARLGMIHRDVKPANLLMTPDGQAKIIDLGLALQAADEDERVTRDGTTVGTVDYMSPEQARDSRKITERSDIYSLGCTLHYLLTGVAPYTGGNLADKLARHHSGEIPDVRDRDPSIPAALSRLIQKMMAKKPEQRFTDYNELILALDRISSVEPNLDPQLSDVLIDDSDDDDEDYYELTVASDSPADAPKPTPRPDPDRQSAIQNARSDADQVREVSLADLAALDADPPSSSTKRRGITLASSMSPEASQMLGPISEGDDEDFEEASQGRSRNELPLQTWIAAGLMVGLLIAVVGFGVRFALSLLTTPKSDQVVSTAEAPEEITPGSEANPLVVPPQVSPSITRAIPPSIAPRKSELAVESREPVKVESKTGTYSPTEASFSSELLARFGVRKESTASVGGSSNKVSVRRLLDSNDGSQTTSLASAFDRSIEEVEIADIGPFHEDDFLIAGRSRIIRAKPGLRPIVKIEDTRQLLIRDQEAKFMLGLNGVEQLTIEGMDLVVDVRDLPLSQSTLFLCQGVDLTLRDCSITITNAEDRRNGFSVFRLANGPRPNRLRVERSLIRGPIQTLAQVVSTQAEVALDRSVIAGSNGSLFQFDPADRSERSIQLYRSVLITRGSAFSWTGKPGATSIRSLGTTFAHVETSTPAPLMVARGAIATDQKSWLDYDGEANRWCGWASFSQWGSPPTPSSRVRESIREVWPQADSSSSESPTSWSATSIAEKMTASDLVDLAPGLESTLAQVAIPHPYLLEMTVDLFPRLPTPELRDDITSEAGSSGSKQTISLSFNASPDSPGDLGQFLENQVTDSSKRYIVRIQGSGSHPMSPVRLPDGVSVVLAGPPGEGTTNPVPVFYASKSGMALIELHEGDLAIANLGFATDGVHRTRHWILVGEGLLALRRCRYRDMAVPDGSVGAAIAFEAQAANPIPPRSGAFRNVTDRPVASLKDCWIWTTSDGIVAEAGRGVVRLDNCVLLAGEAAIRLKRSVVPASQLEADLILENCTLVDDRFGVLLEPTLSQEFGIGRPWLVVSRSSVFPRNWREGGALLGADPKLFAQGALFWQSSNDLYEVSRFLTTSGPLSNATGPPADLKRHWIDLWGLVHTRRDRGPDSKRADRVIHFRDKDRPRTSRPTLTQLELDPKSHSGQGSTFKALPPIPRS